MTTQAQCRPAFNCLDCALHPIAECLSSCLVKGMQDVSVEVGMLAGRSEEWHKALTILSRNVLPRLCKVRLLTPKHWVLTSYATQQMACKL